jgi:hypothetical protein
MKLRSRIESLYDEQVAELLACPEFQDLEPGTAAREAYDQFMANVVRVHLTRGSVWGPPATVWAPEGLPDLPDGSCGLAPPAGGDYSPCQ